MSLGFVENKAARSPGRYTLQDVLSHEAAFVAYRMISQSPRYAATPLVSLDRLAARAGVGAVWYKDESGRFGMGSFKALGGAYAVARLLQRWASAKLGRDVSISELAHGGLRPLTNAITVTCATDGNHGRSVAAGAQIFGCRCVIFLHRDVSSGREAAIRAYGADIIRVDDDYDATVRESSRVAKEKGWSLVSDTSWPGYEDVPRDVMQGYTVMLIETLQQLGTMKAAPLTHTFVQGGVGGLAAAVCAHLWEAAGNATPPTMVVVEPARADCLFQSARAGEPRPSSGDLSTVMAGLACGEVSQEAWRILSKGARFFLTIDDEAAIEGMRLLASGGAAARPIVAGESATAGLAGLLAVAADPELRREIGLTSDSNILLIGSEGATDPVLYEKLVGKSAEAVAAGAAQ